MIEDYLPSRSDSVEDLSGLGGVFNPVNLNVYAYIHQNPIKFIDPNGKELVSLLFGKDSAFDKVPTVDRSFAPVAIIMNEAAKKRGITIVLIHDFRREGQELTNTVVNPAKNSIHKVGRALDINLEHGGKYYNSKMLEKFDELPKEVQEFLKEIEGLKVSTEVGDRESKVIWGGRWKKQDTVHIQMETSDDIYKTLYEENQEQWKGEKPIKFLHIEKSPAKPKEE
jgi:hypothetical protein